MASVCDYTLVDTREKAETAIRSLKSSTLLSVDCEGVNLGRDGELCLLQIAVNEKVYLFDIVALRTTVFDMGLRKILEDPSITKLFYDCRGDCSALQHQHHVVVAGIEDLQLLNTIQMRLKGKHWQCVTGLNKCMDYHLKGCGFSVDAKARMHRALDNDKTLWKRRPLTDEFLSYAATDVFFLARLREVMYCKTTAHHREDLIEVVKYASKRYADFTRDNSACTRTSPYFNTALLPERIVPDVRRAGQGYSYTPFFDETGRLCRCCNWRTDTRPDGQCNRCYNIDRPESSRPPQKRPRYSIH